ncbi:l-asparaginase ii [Colletotrichum camelliae]|nr:l-asparaginase ii [Colletotrichum camelliae]
MKRSELQDDCIFSDRGGIIENTHRIHAAVTDASGNLLYAVGNPSRMTLARSAAKPVQILALLEIEGFDKLGFDDADLALMCSSHSSEEQHIQRGRSMLAKIQAEEQQIRCGGHAALSEAVNKEWIRQGFVSGPLCNNCSAKHIAMLAGAKALGKDEEYHLPEHEVQKRVRRTFDELSSLGPGEIKWGTDGCNLPAPALPLSNISHLYAVLADAADLVARDSSSVSQRTRHLAKMYEAMWRFPEMVGGEGRFCTELMLTYDGAVVGKLGADGCYGVAVRDSDDTRRLGATSGIGIAVKVEDGNEEILYVAVMEILKQLGIGSEERRQELSVFQDLQRVNTAGVVTGKVSCSFKVRKA